MSSPITTASLAVTLRRSRRRKKCPSKHCRLALLRRLRAIDDALDLGSAGVEFAGDKFVLVLKRLYIRLGVLDDAHLLVAFADGIAPQTDVLHDRYDAREKRVAELLHEAALIHRCRALFDWKAQMLPELDGVEAVPHQV